MAAAGTPRVLYIIFSACGKCKSLIIYGELLIFLSDGDLERFWRSREAVIEAWNSIVGGASDYLLFVAAAVFAGSLDSAIDQMNFNNAITI